MALAGLSTLGIKLAYGEESTSGAKPTKVNLLTRINSIGGISIEPETIDASALEDLVERTVAGRASTGGSWSVTVNFTPETRAEWEKLQTTYKGGKRLWFEVLIPNMTDGFWVVAQPPQELPLPEMGQNDLLTMEIPLTIEEYKGLSAKVEPTATSD